MYTIIIETDFDASHFVRMPDGHLEEPHTHKWQLTVAVQAEQLDENGFAIEFLELKDIIDASVAQYKDKLLNELSIYKTNFPTTERVCKNVHENLKKSLPFGVSLDYTLLQEAKGFYVKYRD